PARPAPVPYTTLFRSRRLRRPRFGGMRPRRTRRLWLTRGFFLRLNMARSLSRSWSAACPRVNCDPSYPADPGCAITVRLVTDVRSEEHTSELQSRENL